MANNSNQLTRRELGRKAALAGGAMAASSLVAADATETLERRQLGKTGIEVGILGIGTSPLGQPGVTQQEVNRVIAMAADEGVNYLDAAPIYGMAERRLGPPLKGKRDKFVLISKVEATSKQDATWQIKESLHKMQTDYLDVVHLHNVGRTDRFPDLDVLMGEDGALQGLRDVDRHTYNFEGTVFAEAAKRGMGVVAMKILGGTDGDHAKLSADEHYTTAVRYALGIPGLSVAIMGMKNTAELQKALATVRSYKPLSSDELTQLNNKGKMLAKSKDWGELRGPVAWDGDKPA